MSQQSSLAFDLLSKGVQKALWSMKWQELNDLQIQSIPKVLKTERNLILSAATASGKTEAAFLPILSAIVEEEISSLSVIYIGPLKALINDQFNRLEDLCEHLDIPVNRWHGDISADVKKKFIASPRGVLLITPESLESLFVNRTQYLMRLFGGLRFIVVDELHAFLDNARGRHLRNLLDRVARLQKYRIIGLSATIGDPKIAQSWVDRHDPNSVEVITGDNPEGELRCALRAYQIDPHQVHEDDDDTPQPEVNRMAEDIVKRHCGKSNLIFCNAKSQVEELADCVARIVEAKRLPDQILVHHGALSAESRVEAEEIMKSGAIATTFCSSTLEMGIDIGSVEQVGQVGSPFSVSGLKQRAGRSGRKLGSSRTLRLYIECEKTDAKTEIIDRMHVNLIQSIAMVDLMVAAFIETPRPANCDLSTLTQQIISVIAETGGISALKLHDCLCVQGAFPAVDTRLFAELLRSLASHDIVEQAGDGSLILGLRGEAVRKDKGFYAVFATPDEFAVLHDGRAIGKIGYMPGEHQIKSRFLLARKRWQITDIDLEGKVIFVKPSRTRKPAIFATSDAADLDAAIVEKMRQVLLVDDIPAYIDETAKKLLASARASARMAGLLNRGLVPLNDHSTAVMLWTGTRVNNTIVAWLKMNGITVVNWGVGLVVAENIQKVQNLLQRFVNEPPAAIAIVAEFPPPSAGKYDRFLTDNLRHETYIRDNIDIAGGKSVLSEFLSAKPTSVPRLINVPNTTVQSETVETVSPLIAVIDVETTGLFPQKHDRIIEIAVVVMTLDGTIVREFESLINPDRDIGPTRIHGLTAGDVVSAPGFNDVLSAMMPSLQGTVAVAGHNVRFDISFLKAECERAEIILPELPSICTLRLAGGGCLADCCSNYQVQYEGSAHNALHDARATARLLALLLREKPRDLRSITTSKMISWPTLPPSSHPLCTRQERRAAQKTQTSFLSRLATERSRTTAPPDDHSKSAYLNVLDRVLEDRRIVEVEADELITLASSLGLTREDVVTCHREYLTRLACIALSDGIVTDVERSDLLDVGRLLGLASKDVDEALSNVQRVPTPATDNETDNLRGMHVCFTGELQCRFQDKPITRDIAESLATDAGLIAVDSVTKKLDLLVVADPDTASGKAKKARQYGIRILHEKVFWKKIDVEID